MKALILHANRWMVRVETPSERIVGCEPEELHDDNGEGTPKGTARAIEQMDECLVVLFQVEKGDCGEEAAALCSDIRSIAQELGAARLMVSGFAHLSSSWPKPAVAKELFLRVVATCKSWGEFQVGSSHFGWNKSLLLDIKSHANAVKHRSYCFARPEGNGSGEKIKTSFQLKDLSGNEHRVSEVRRLESQPLMLAVFLPCGCQVKSGKQIKLVSAKRDSASVWIHETCKKQVEPVA